MRQRGGEFQITGLMYWQDFSPMSSWPSLEHGRSKYLRLSKESKKENRDEAETYTKHKRLTEKQEAATIAGQWDKENLDRKTCHSEKLAEMKNSSIPRPKAQSCNEYQNRAVQADTMGGKRSKMEKLLWRTQCWNNTDTVLAILPTNKREWSYQNNPRHRRHQQGKAKDQWRETLSFTWVIHTTEQSKQLRGKKACTECSQQNTCTQNRVALMMNSQRRNSMMPLEKKKKIHSTWSG